MSNIVYTHSSTPVRMRKRARGVAASAFRGGDGRYHTYLNAAWPHDLDATADDSVCKRCGYGYSHVMTERREICNECVVEDAADHALYWQDMCGIDLGWKTPEDYRPPLMRPLSRGDTWGMHMVRRR